MVPGLFGASCGGSHQRVLDDCELDTSLRPPSESEGSPLVGYLTIQLLLVRDLPPQPFLLETNSYVNLTVGDTTLTTQRLPGCNPGFKCTLKFDVNKYDAALKLRVWRENVGWG